MCIGLLTWAHPFPLLHLGWQLTINSTTTLCQSKDSPPPETGAENPGWTLYTQREHDFLTPQTHHTQGRVDNLMHSPTPPLCGYPLCAVQIHTIWEEDFSSSVRPNPNEQTKFRVTWPGTLHEGAWKVKGHHHIHLTQHLQSILAASSPCHSSLS